VLQKSRDSKFTKYQQNQYFVSIGTTETTLNILKASVVSSSKKLYSYCLDLVGSRNGFERDFHNRTNKSEGFMED